MSGVRRAEGYSHEEDVLVCDLFIEVFEDSIRGRNQKGERLYAEIAELFIQRRPPQAKKRSWRSLQSRLSTITTDCKKLNGCLKQVENLNPSGASDSDILCRAKELLMQDSDYKKGFKFDHVWEKVLGYSKFFSDVPTARQRGHGGEQSNVESSQSDNPSPPSPGITFAVNLDDDYCGSMPSLRPMGVKQAKAKRKNDGVAQVDVTHIKQSNDNMLELLGESKSDRKRIMQIQEQSLALKLKRAEERDRALKVKEEALALERQREEHKIMFCDLNAIPDPQVRAYVIAERHKIEQRTNQQAGSSSSTNPYSGYFSMLGGNEPDFPPPS